MSRTTSTPLHILWSPNAVRAINVATGEAVEARSIPALGAVLSGQKDVIVGVAHNHVFLKSVRLPKAAPQDLRNILLVQLGQLFPLPPDQLSFDFIQTADQTPEGWLTVVAAIRSDDLRAILGELREVGLTAGCILPAALAASAAAQQAGLTDAIVAESSGAGEPLTLDVVQGGTLRFSRVTTATSDPTVEAQRTIAAARAGSLPAVTLGNVNLPGAIRGTGSLLSLLHVAPEFRFELMEDRLVAITKRQRDRTRLGALMMFAAMALITLVWFDRSDAQAIVTRSQGTWARQILTLTSVEHAETSQAATYVQLQNTLNTAFHSPQPISDIAAIVDDALPPGAWITGMNIQRGKPIDVRGTARVAADVTRFVDKLGASPRFRDVRLVFANSATIGKTSVVQFSISAVSVGNLPMPVPDTVSGYSSRTSSSAAGSGQ